MSSFKVGDMVVGNPNKQLRGLFSSRQKVGKVENSYVTMLRAGEDVLPYTKRDEWHESLFIKC